MSKSKSKPMRLIGLANTSLGRVIDLLEAEGLKYNIITNTKMPDKSKIQIAVDDLALKKNLKLLSKRSVVILLSNPPVVKTLLKSSENKDSLLDIESTRGTLEYIFKSFSSKELKHRINYLLKKGGRLKSVEDNLELLPSMYAEVQGQITGDILTLLMSITKATDRVLVKHKIFSYLLSLTDMGEFDTDVIWKGLEDSITDSTKTRLRKFLKYLRSRKGINYVSAIAECNEGTKFDIEGKKIKSPLYKKIAEKHGVNTFDLKYVQKQRATL